MRRNGPRMPCAEATRQGPECRCAGRSRSCRESADDPAIRARRPIPFPALIQAAAGAQRVPAFTSSPWLPSLNSLAAPWPLRVARMPEPRSGGNGGWPFIFRRGPFRVRFASRSKINGPSPSSAALRPRAKAHGATPARAPGKKPRQKGRKGRLPTSRRRNP